jgi:hypothetical protein
MTARRAAGRSAASNTSGVQPNFNDMLLDFKDPWLSDRRS